MDAADESPKKPSDRRMAFRGREDAACVWLVAEPHSFLKTGLGVGSHGR